MKKKGGFVGKDSEMEMVLPKNLFHLASDSLNLNYQRNIMNILNTQQHSIGIHCRRTFLILLIMGCNLQHYTIMQSGCCSVKIVHCGK